MAEESEVSKDLEEKFMPSSHKKILAALLVAVVVAAGGYAAMNMNSFTTATTDNTTDTANSNSTSNSTTDQVGLTASQIEGEVVEVTLTDIKAEPSSPRIAPEDGIRFVNEAGVDVEFTFDREISNFQLAAGDSIIVDPTSIIYYDVAAQDEDAEFRGISARINVQG